MRGIILVSTVFTLCVLKAYSVDLIEVQKGHRTSFEIANKMHSNCNSVPVWYNLACPRHSDLVFQGHGIGTTLKEASSEAWGAVFRNAGMSGTRIVGSELEDIMTSGPGGRNNTVYTRSFGQGTLEKQYSPLFRVLAVYETPGACRDGYYHSYILVAIRQKRNIRLSYPRNFGAAVRSLVFPGWGQIYKGDHRAGVEFLTVISLSAAASVLLWKYSDYCNHKARLARTENARSVYERRCNITFYSSAGAAVLFGITYTGNIFHARSITGIPRLR